MTGDFPFVGERLCLDFVNTEIVRDGVRVDLIGGFDDLLAWTAAARIAGGGQVRELAASWSTPDTTRAFQHAQRFRKVLRAMAARLASGRSGVPGTTLDAINEVLRARVGELAVVRTKAGYDTRFLAHWSGPEQLLVPVAESAASLLTSGNLALVRKCENPACILYFYDTTKNHGRRWCSMSACGNRAKVAAHYRRTHGTGAAD
ncbi:MAG: CGNR zinc finger domain-containing protein [Vicinamibacteria bacterium]